MTPAAVLLDALGTLVRLEPPAPRLRDSLAARLRLDVPLDRCEAAMRAEMRHYAAENVRARDDASLAALRLECAEVLADALQAGPTGAELLACLTDAIAFTAYPDAAVALARLRELGVRTAVVSNWDVSLGPTLARLGLDRQLDVVVHSAEAGAAKPDPAPFRLALARLRLGPDDVVHIGDDPRSDVAGAAAAGIQALLIDRESPAGPRRVASLLELPEALGLVTAA
jgi:putative hydrolase of the HAD superfamily